MSFGDVRHIVLMPNHPPSWELPPAEDGELGSGGHRYLHELAVAIAATGRRVEVRGQFDFSELRALGAAAGAMPELPAEPRRPGSGDVVLMPEGFDDPLVFAIVALSEARAILLMLGPVGLFGWGFVSGWHMEHPHEVAIDSVARAEQHRAVASMGFEIWVDSSRLAERVEATGVPCTLVGTGRPLARPKAMPKRYDVATLDHNRWAPLARSVVARLDEAVTHHEIPASSNDELLRQLGQARVLIHPLRVEGASRLGNEARAMGTVPVVLSSNPYSEGLDEAGGAVAVASLEEMPSAVMQLLRDPDRLSELQARGMRAAREESDWARFVSRVDSALTAEPADDPARGARGAIGDRLAQTDAALRGEINELHRALGLTRSDRDLLAARLESIEATRVWRLARRYWGARDALRRRGARRPPRSR